MKQRLPMCERMYNTHLYLCITELATGLESASPCSVTRFMKAHQRNVHHHRKNIRRNCMSARSAQANSCPQQGSSPSLWQRARGWALDVFVALTRSHLVSARGRQLGLFWKAWALTTRCLPACCWGLDEPGEEPGPEEDVVDCGGR